jgi:hypothetical protein
MEIDSGSEIGHEARGGPSNTRMGVAPPAAPAQAESTGANSTMDAASEARVVVGKFLRGCTCYDLIKDSSKVCGSAIHRICSANLLRSFAFALHLHRW